MAEFFCTYPRGVERSMAEFFCTYPRGVERSMAEFFLHIPAYSATPFRVAQVYPILYNVLIGLSSKIFWSFQNLLIAPKTTGNLINICSDQILQV